MYGGTYLLQELYIFFKSIDQWVAVLGPVGAALGLLWKYYLKSRFLEIKNAHNNLHILVSYLPKIEAIEAELKPNGGSSVRDAINRIEAKLTLQDQKLFALMKVMSHGIFITDVNGNWVDVNLTLCRITNRTESELKEKEWLTWIADSDRINVDNQWNLCVKNKMSCDVEFDVILPDDTIKSLRIITHPLKNDKGEATGFFGTVYEIV